MKNRKLYIETLGCPKNFNDSEGIGGIWEEAGGEIVSSPQEADVVLVNTCGFINDAKVESIDAIFDMTRLPNKPKIIVSGCLSQRYGQQLADEIPEIDYLLGVNDYERLPEIVGGQQRIHTSGAPACFNEFSSRKLPDTHYSATLRIAEGCNNCCAYCVIPQIRGPYRSRPEEKILEEAGALAKAGVRELILIAQDLTEYGRDLYGELRLASLLRKLCRIGGDDLDEGFRWIRLMYCYEDRITDELIEVMASEKRICKYIDIPLQHISDSVLKDMRRKSTSESIRGTISRLREAMPDIHIRTTFITGFPGETEEDFEELANFVEEARFERLGVFAYSQEEGTPAGEMENQIEEEEKKARADSIMRLQLDISREHNEEKVGKVLDVLVEGIDEVSDDFVTYMGRSEYDAPEIDGSVIFRVPVEEKSLEPGDFASVLIEDAFDYDLAGTAVREKG
ncbi:MAG: 30S ribosomal protein S12 methylthiotransferase RimO [Firmicutes bacterium]|nr:30S ribosomal protein S12 methylthiotransferase RimO [Bacillota bacterium]